MVPVAEGDKMAAGGARPLPPWLWSGAAGPNPNLPKNKTDWQRTSDLISRLEKKLK